MYRRLPAVLPALLAMVLLATPARAEIDFFGTAKIKPTFYTDFDFQSGKTDRAIINEGGLTGGEHVRAELRLGWKASGDAWSVKMIAEADVIMTKDSADRSYYTGAEDIEGRPNSGGEFGIERVELLYRFFPWLELQTGWDIRALDIKTGGLLFGDDHPFIGFRGNLAPKLQYEALYLPIQNRGNLPIKNNDVEKILRSSTEDDWRVYSLKLTQDLAAAPETLPQQAWLGNKEGRGPLQVSLSPFYAFSDNDSKDAQIHYFGMEAIGQVGWFRPSFEVVAAEGEFDNGRDISSWAMFAGLEMGLHKAFTPYLAFRYAQGDNNAADNKVKGWVGITDIGRFTPLMGMDGNILGEDMGQSYGATLYSYSPERALGTNRYGGIGNGGSGDNPGQKLLAVGARGDLSQWVKNLMYKSQAFFIWYDETNNLTNVRNPGRKVDSYAGTTFDLQLMYAFSKNFSVDYIFSTFIPGDGIKDQFGDDPAFVNCLTLAWSY